MTTEFPKEAFKKIMLRSGYAKQDYGWGEISLGNQKWPKINFEDAIFHKNFEDECELTLVKSKEVLLGIVDADARIHPINTTQFVVINHEFYRRFELTLINIQDLQPIEAPLDDVVPQFMEAVPKHHHLKDLKSDFQCYFPRGVKGKCNALQELCEGSNLVSFKGDFDSTGEFLISYATCIFQFSPLKGQITILPQDWIIQNLLEDLKLRYYGFSRDPDSGQIFGFLNLWKPQELSKYETITKYVRLDNTDTNLETWLELI